jgi:hypothetical protein
LKRHERDKLKTPSLYLRNTTTIHTLYIKHIYVYEIKISTTGESGAEFVDSINAAAMKLEKAGEVVSDAAKLTRLIHPNQESGSVHDKLGMTIDTTPDITFDKASGLFEMMEHSGLAPVPPAEYVNAIFCNYCRQDGHKTKICRKKSATKTIKSGKPPAVHQSIILKISPENDVIFCAVSAMPKITDLMNVLD